MVMKMFIEIKSCIPMTHVFKGHVKIIRTYMVKLRFGILKSRDRVTKPSYAK